MLSVQYFCANLFCLKQKLLILVSLFIVGIAFGQTDSIKKTAEAETSKTTIIVPVKKVPPSIDTSKTNTVLTDSLKTDSLRKDSLVAVSVKPVLVQEPDTLTYQKYYTSAWLPFEKVPVFEIEPERKPRGMETMFYVLTGLVTALACIRLIFPKYFKNLFLLFMQTSIRQKQTREQLLQNNLASVLLNILFVASAGIYITLFIQFKHWVEIPFYQLLLYSVGILFIVYLGKFLFLAFSGWVFNVPEATNAYTFIVFLVNKVLGIVLIPFVLLITFSPLPIKEISITISAGLAILLIMYRYLISFGVVRLNLKVSALHFFLYLCAVEVLPLLLIYKLLVNFVSGSI
jgi:hypothetical protein